MEYNNVYCKFYTKVFDELKVFDTISFIELEKLYLKINKQLIESRDWIAQDTINGDSFAKKLAKNSDGSEKYIFDKGSFSKKYRNSYLNIKPCITGKSISKESYFNSEYILLSIPKEIINNYQLSSISSDSLDIVREFVRDVEPGEMVVISNNGIESIFPFRRQNSKFCIFEHVYFSRPDSIIHGQSVYETRRRIGVELAKESPIDADLVCPVPDSGTPAAIGFSQQSGIPYAMGIIRNQYMGRTFIEPTEQIRNMGVRLKLNVNRALIKGKRIILVDDSVVRGTTSRKIKEMIIDAGAKEVHFRIASPPTAWPCFYGVDTPQREKLIAATMTEEEMRKHLSVNTLKFISLDGLYRATGEKEGRDTKCPQYCDACFSGEYPVLPSDMIEKGFKLKHAEIVDGS